MHEIIIGHKEISLSFLLENVIYLRICPFSLLFFLHSHGFSGFDEAHRPTLLSRASFCHWYHN